MAYPLLQFVDGPSSTATLRYDFNTKNASYRTHPLGADGLDLGVPSFTGEPGGVGVDYGYRRLSLTQRIEGTKAQAMDRMTALARELLRADNWLKVQLDATSPAQYFRTYRTEPGALSLEHVETAQAWDIQVPLVAEGFTYGPRETMSTFQVVQGEVDLTGPTRTAMRVVLPAIKGDAPTPLRVTITPASGAAGLNSSWLIGCISGTSSMVDAIFNIGGDALTAGSGTGASTGDATYFTDDYRLVTIGAGSNYLVRLSGSVGWTAVQGRFKVMLRCVLDGSTTADKPYIFGFGTGPLGGTINYNPSTTVTVPQNGTAYIWRGWVDLGDVTFPSLASLPRDVVDPPTASTTSSQIGLKVGTSDNTAGTARIDALKLIPIDGAAVTSAQLLKASFNAGQTVDAGDAGTFDGDTQSFWLVSSGALQSSRPTLDGAFPLADPAATQNLLIVMATAHGDGITSSATSTITTENAQAAVDVSYYPRYLYLGDGT